MLSPFRISVLKSWLLAVPIEKREETEIRLSMIQKELTSLESTAREATVQWQSILAGYDGYRIHDGYHPNVTHSVHSKVHIWASRVSSKILFPHFGHKILGSNAQRSITPIWQDKDLGISSWQAEYHYMMTGEEGESPCEMKQAWIPSQMVPRTYYAQGLSAYHSSKYLRDPFNELADMFRNVNRFSRVLPQMIVADSTDTLYIYDLTSFSSLFHEHRSFLLSLAEEVKGYDVRFYDSHTGIGHTSLSFLIEEYVRINVDRPEYTSMLLPIDDMLVLHQNVAGFLGVYGNLITCTIPHGILLASVNDSWLNNWCAGDDAGEAIPEDLFSRLDVTAKKAGTYAPEKIFVGNEPGAVALKRPVSFYYGLVIFKSTPMFPLLGYLLQPSRFGSRETKSLKFLQETMCSSMIGFLRYSLPLVFDESFVDEILAYTKFIFNSLHLPLNGHLPHVLGHRPWNFSIPIIDRDMFSENPLRRLAEKYYSTHYCCTLREESVTNLSELFIYGSSVGNMTPWLKWAVSMGFVYAEKRKVIIVGVKGFLALLDDLYVTGHSNHTPTSFNFTVVDKLPRQHLATLVL